MSSTLPVTGFVLFTKVLLRVGVTSKSFVTVAVKVSALVYLPPTDLIIFSISKSPLII